MLDQPSDRPTPDAIVFDVGGVFVTVDNDSLFARLASRCTPGVTPAQVARLLGDPIWDRGTPIAELHTRLRAELGYTADWATFRDDWSHHLDFDESMLALIEMLARRHRVILFSNTNKEHWDHLSAFPGGRLRRFEQVVSYELKLSKPSMDAFRRMAEVAEIAPERSLFFDDRADNVAGARAAGFKAELFVDEATLRRSLEAAKVAVV